MQVPSCEEGRGYVTAHLTGCFVLGTASEQTLSPHVLLCVPPAKGGGGAGSSRGWELATGDSAAPSHTPCGKVGALIEISCCVLILPVCPLS